MALSSLQAYSIIFFTGGFLYCGIEILYRGYSHISMFFTAGICFLLIGFIEIVIVALFPALSGYRDAFAFVVLILVLLVKPTGLLGEKTTEKV